ncbi:MAG: hypothetical protein ABT20_10295 [Rubrivivax sp. SCN 70-15]|nr:MAG: hypothetical protein ABT20_10295 [Rubrivivax sp. SCN 70-15]
MRDSADPARRNLGWIRALLPARDGRLWIATESQGLAVYDPASERVTIASGAADGTTPLTIAALAEGRDGTIWVGTVGAGLERYDPASGRSQWFRHGQGPGSLPDDRVGALLVDRQGRLWVGTRRGLSRLGAGSDQFEPLFSSRDADAASLAHQSVQALFQASDGRIWVGTQQGGLAIVDPSTGQGWMLGAGDAGRDSHPAVNGFVEAPDGRVWVASESRIDLRARADGRLLRQLRHDPRRPFGLAANEVTTLLRDRAGLIWVGGLGLGLQRCDPADVAIRMREADLRPGSPFSEADVRSLLQTDDGTLWVATHDGCVALMDTALQVTGSVCPSAGEGRPPGGRPMRVEAMAQARDGTVWLGGTSALLQYARRGARRLRVVRQGAGRTNALLADRDGALWVGTEDGLYRLAPHASALERIARADGKPLRGDVFEMALGPGGALWVASGEGLFRIAPGGRALEPVVGEPGATLGSSTVIGLLFDREHRLWVDTAVTGLHRMLAWDGHHARFDRVSERHGIVGRPFGVNLMQDRRGRIWTQMYVYDPATDHLEELTKADGVLFGTGWFRSYAKLADGRMLFGGSKGLLVVEPERFERSDDAPPVVATELRIDGHREPAGRIARGVTLPPGQRSVSLEFAALDYRDPARLRYAHRLDGFDRDWVTTGAEQRSATYGNLDPGHYLLRVRATNRSGRWSPHELAIGVDVLPAWWQRAWFRAALVLMAAGLVAVVVQWRTRHLRRLGRELEQKARERTAELEAMARALVQESAALAEASPTDPLTGLHNRRFLAQHIELDTATATRRHGHRAAGAAPPDDTDLIFFLVDLDEFKQVNDRHGHAAGDDVIRQMRGRLVQVFRESDYLVRWDGEEFLAVARYWSRRYAAALAERVRAAVADRPFELDDGTRLHLTCSVGFCCFPLAPRVAGALDWNDSVRLADAALYAVKTSGRNGWLGLVGCRSESIEALRAGLRGSLADWARSGELNLAGSPGLDGWPAQGD